MVFWTLVGALGLFTHLRGLGASALWQDEAETAVLARRVQSYGVPRVDDGVNLVSQNQGRDADAAGRWNYSPWLAFYLAAASMAVLGPTAFAARLPFSLCALAALVLLFRLSRRWSGSDGVAAGAVALTSLSVPWLLHARQCRWYGPGALFSLCLWWAYEEWLARAPRARLKLALASAALFYTNFLVFFAAAGGLALHFLAARARQRPPERGDVRAAALLFLLLLPGMAYFDVLGRADGSGGVPVSRLMNLREILAGADAHVFPFWAAALAAVLAWRTPRLRRPLALLSGGLLTLVLAPHFFFRYLIIFIPLAAHLLAETAVLSGYPAALAAALLLTNAASLGPWLGLGPFLKRDLRGFAAELRAPVQDPVRAAAELMAKTARPGDVALVSYPDLSFMFHVPGLRVVGGGQGPRPVQAEAVRFAVVRDEREKSTFPLDWSRYDAVPLDAPNGPWGNRPDPGLHVFRTLGGPPAVVYVKR